MAYTKAVAIKYKGLITKKLSRTSDLVVIPE
jgi:hypothetical protein